MVYNLVMTKVKRVAVLGLGYVGLPLALLTSRKGFDAIGIDLDKDKVEKVNNQLDPLSDEYTARHIKGTSLKASTELSALADCDIAIICVPTPVKHDYQPDLGPLKGAATSVAKHMKKGTLVIVESTINPGVCDEVIIPLIEKVSGMKVNTDFYVSHCPERINPGDEKWNVENIPRVVGSSNQEGLKQTVEFYEDIVDAAIKPMGSLKEAEACKVVENSFRDINIAFVNELAKSFTKLGINVKNVIDGAATKPFAFMPHYPSIGVGGHCIPVDPYYLIEYARGYGFEHEFLSLARSINNSMPEFTVDRLTSALNGAGYALSGTKVALLGLSYKANVADDRESPSYKVLQILKDRGAAVRTFDPHLLDKSSVKTLDEALEGAEAVIIASSHKEFLDIDYNSFGIKVLVDGKNCLDATKVKNAKFVYHGIGV